MKGKFKRKRCPRCNGIAVWWEIVNREFNTATSKMVTCQVCLGTGKMSDAVANALAK